MWELLYYSLLGITSLIALRSPRTGVLLAIPMDILRDPVRKLSESQSVAITLSYFSIWFCIFLNVIPSNTSKVRELLIRHPQLRAAVPLIAAALLPAAAVTVFTTDNGTLIAGIGLASYVIPLLGLGVGYILFADITLILRMMTLYVVCNSIAMLSSVAEWSGFEWAVLGGINVEWIRYRADSTVDLISGIYRSPDVMGLHAANAMMFSGTILLTTPRRGKRAALAALALWCGLSLLLCGRRKMLAIIVVFLVVCISQLMRKKERHSTSIALSLVALALTATIAAYSFSQGESALADYTAYAQTIVTEADERINNQLIGSSIGTLQQSGILGAGLGTATQGRYLLGASQQGARGWQEDGVSRVLLEFGLPGAVLILVCLVLLARAVLNATRVIPIATIAGRLQLGLVAIVAGNFASYVIAHQHFSGDPASALLVTILLGAVFIPQARSFAR